MAPDNVTLERLAQLLQSSQVVLVTSHPDPDGDAIGSTLAASIALRGMGKQVVT